MAWPTPQDYNEAVQNPRLAFLDSDLQRGQPELTLLGLPRPISGNFACVYKIEVGGQRWAARCFNTEVSDQQQRYEAISAYLAKVNLPYTVQFTYIQNGIKLLGRHYPLLKMQWVQGESLDLFVGKTLGYPDTLLSLAKVWSKMMADLKAVSIAHGDLQHGNVVVVGDQLKLIDYDGMFVPGLAGNQSKELGHRNYQLPSRSPWDYGPYLDNFSAWVIYVSLIALAVHPELWNAHRGGDECLIFRKEDFVKPENSAVLRNLNSSSHAQLRILTEFFTGLFYLSPQDVPSLDGHLMAIQVDPPKRWWTDYTENQQPGKEEPTGAIGAIEGASDIVDPSWIVDSIMEEKTFEPLLFQNSIRNVQRLLAGSMSLVFLTRILVTIPAAEVFIASFCIFGLNLLFCYICYKRDPSQVEFAKFKQEYKAFIKTVGDHQTVLAGISAERRKFEEQLNSVEQKIAAKKSLFVADLQVNLNFFQLDLDSHLQRLDQRHKDTSSSETNKINSIQKTLGNQIANIDQQIALLIQNESLEKGVALDSLRDAYVHNILLGHSIRSSSIPGIGDHYKTRLTSSGFVTAADINWQVTNVYGIGQTRAAALIAWRQSIERSARKSAAGIVSMWISSTERQSIEDKYRSERKLLDTERQLLQVQKDNLVASTHQFFADLQKGLSEEEQQLRAANSDKQFCFRQEHVAKIALLDQELGNAKMQAAPKLDELSQQLQSATKQILALKWQSAKKAYEGRRFTTLGFRNYLCNVLKP